MFVRVGEDANPDGSPSLPIICEFMWDRTRAIRKEYALQGYKPRGRNDALMMEVSLLTPVDVAHLMSQLFPGP